MLDTGYDWDECLALIEMHMRAAVSKPTGFSPYEILFGKKMNTNLNDDFDGISQKNVNFNSTEEYVKWLAVKSKAIEEKVKTIDQTENQMKNQNKGVHNLPPFTIGQKVLVKILPHLLSSFGQRYEGPFEVVKKIGKYSYTLQDRNGKRIDRHHDHLKTFVERRASTKECVESSILSESERKPDVGRQCHVTSRSSFGKQKLVGKQCPKEKTQAKIPNKTSLAKDRPKRDKAPVDRYGFSERGGK